jgi:phosphate transport system substrate-binding protein
MLTTNSDGVPVLETASAVRRRFIMSLGFFALLGLLLALLYNSGSSERLMGSGSTFAQPLVERLTRDFRTEQSGGSDWSQSDLAVTYEPVGSLGGIMRLQDPEVDFALTDYALSGTALEDLDAFQFPIAVGSIAVGYNLKSHGAPQLNMSAKLVSAVFRGEVTRWNDPAIAVENAGLALPDIPIKVAFRGDGSGTTLNFSSFLGGGDDSWRTSMGSSTELKWPTGTALKGSSAMAAFLAMTDGSIGYLEAGQASRAGLELAALQTASGGFVLPEKANVLAKSKALLDATQSEETLSEAYPLVAVVYAIVKTGENRRADRAEALRFFHFLFDQGDARIEELGYLSLPSSLRTQIISEWSRRFGWPRSS